MAQNPTDLSSFVTALMPSLSRSLAEQFNIFRVMHHGTHEKQISNVFSWLLRPDATHDLGDTFQRIFVDCVNRSLPEEAQVPPAGYQVTQEVNTQGDPTDEVVGMDIADILLTRDDAAVIIENYEISDGHGHGFHRYRAHAAASGRVPAVVLLCHRREAHLLRDGWEEAVVVTYADVLGPLQQHISQDARWVRSHPDQHLFIQQMVQHFVEGPAAVNLDDQIAFIKSMCDTGESERYRFVPHERSAQEFADIVAEHARRQFEDSRRTLGTAKASLRGFARTTLIEQVNSVLHDGRLENAGQKYSGIWEWCVNLRRPDPYRDLFLVFGPTAVEVIGRLSARDIYVDYSTVFVTYEAAGEIDLDHVVPTDVGLAEVIHGLPRDDVRLRNAVLELISEPTQS